jgi:hypothetical protein
MASAHRSLYTADGATHACGRGRRLISRELFREVHRSSETNRLMSNSIILLPFVVAFVIFVLRFYIRESASSLANPSFLMALGSVLIIVLYLTLFVLGSLPPYSTLGFGLVGLILLGVSILRMFMI